MEVRVYYNNGCDCCEFEYFSKYNRINARGIKEEIEKQLYQRYGSSARYYEIIDFIRID